MRKDGGGGWGGGGRWFCVVNRAVLEAGKDTSINSHQPEPPI